MHASSRNARLGRVLISLFLAVSTQLGAWADDLKGTIKDALGRPIAGVTVQLLDEKGAILARTSTDKDGNFLFQPAAVGNFSVKLSKAGFKEATRPFDPGTALSMEIDNEEDLEILTKVDRESGPQISKEGALVYSVTDKEIQDKPGGEATTMFQLLTQMPGVAIDQNQQVHIRDQHNNGQYRVNGVMLPLDMYAEPAFISFLNPQFIKRVDLLTGILPAQYGFTNSGGVIDIQTKTGADLKGGTASLTFGQRGTLQPMIQYGGTDGKLDYYGSGMFDIGNTAFSQATPYPEPIHNWTTNAQGFGLVSYKFNDELKLSLMGSITGSRNQLPNVPGLTPQYSLAGVTGVPSQNIDSYLNFSDKLGVISLNGTPSDDLQWQLSYSVHSLAQYYRPDNVGELLYQGVAAKTTNKNEDQSLQGDVTYKTGDHTLKAGFYLSRYNIYTDNTSLVFPTDASGRQSSNQPVSITNNFRTGDDLRGYYINDLWQFAPEWKLNVGVRFDNIEGFTHDHSINPTFNLIYSPTPETSIHAGYARYSDTPAFQAFSPLAQASYNGTTNAAPPGLVNPYMQHDQVYDVGFTHVLSPQFTLGVDGYYEQNQHYGDEGQFGVVPIFVNINYDHGYTWGGELSLKYKNQNWSATPISPLAKATNTASPRASTTSARTNWRSSTPRGFPSTISLFLASAPASSTTPIPGVSAWISSTAAVS